MPQPGERPSANCLVSLDLCSLIPAHMGLGRGPAGGSPAPAPWSLAGLLQVLLPKELNQSAHMHVWALGHSVVSNSE